MSAVLVDTAFRMRRELEPGRLVKECFRADVVVEDLVLVELKSVPQLAAVHKKQTITYLKLMNLRLGLLINFGAPMFSEVVCRLANGLR